MSTENGELRPATKIAVGGFVPTLVATIAFYNGLVFSTTLPNYVSLLVVTVVLLIVASGLIVADLVDR